MKRSIIPFFASLMLVSCTSTSTDKTKGTDADSLSQETECVVESNVCKFNYIHPDTQLFELFGKVKSVVIKEYYGAEEDGSIPEDEFTNTDYLYFKPSGELDMTKDIQWQLPDPKIKRNDKGQIVHVSWYVSEFDYNVTEDYEYDKSGMVQKVDNHGVESDCTKTYTYDDDGYHVSAIEESSGEGSAFMTTISYKIMKKDDNNNWTHRLVKYHEKSKPYDSPGDYTDEMTYYQVETRKIEYYK